MRNDDRAARELAFRLLARVVAEYVETGRQPRGAGLKTELQRRTGGFSESILGYESFGAFLEAAAQDGFVQLRRIPGGDIEVSMPGTDQNVLQGATPTLKPTERPKYIRRDFWRCFLDWTPGWIRLYDRVNDKAVMFSADLAMASDSTLLPVESLLILRAFRIGMPLCKSVPRMRVKRERA